MDDVIETFKKVRGTEGKDTALRKISWSELKSKYPIMYKLLQMPHIFRPCETIMTREHGQVYVIPVNSLLYQFVLYCPRTNELWETYTPNRESIASETAE